MKQLKCKRCGWKWWPRTDKRPTMCPDCKSRKWDEEKEGEGKVPK